MFVGQRPLRICIFQRANGFQFCGEQMQTQTRALLDRYVVFRKQPEVCGYGEGPSLGTVQECFEFVDAQAVGLVEPHIAQTDRALKRLLCGRSRMYHPDTYIHRVERMAVFQVEGDLLTYAKAANVILQDCGELKPEV